MTPEQREQKAREFLASIPGVHDSGGMGSSHDEYVRELVDILAKTERAVLGEVRAEIKGRRCELANRLLPGKVYYSGVREDWKSRDEALSLLDAWIDKQAKERS